MMSVRNECVTGSFLFLFRLLWCVWGWSRARWLAVCPLWGWCCHWGLSLCLKYPVADLVSYFRCKKPTNKIRQLCIPRLSHVHHKVIFYLFIFFGRSLVKMATDFYHTYSDLVPLPPVPLCPTVTGKWSHYACIVLCFSPALFYLFVFVFEVLLLSNFPLGQISGWLWNVLGTWPIFIVAQTPFTTSGQCATL